jgi:hypothetical protein
MTDPNPLKQAAEEAKARKLAQVQREQKKSETVSVNDIEIVREDWEALDAMRQGLEELWGTPLELGKDPLRVGRNIPNDPANIINNNIFIDPDGRVFALRLRGAITKLVWPLPGHLKVLEMHGAPLLLFTSPLPEGLETLDLSGTMISKFDIPLPQSLKELYLNGSTVSGITVPLPKSLQALTVSGTPFCRTPGDVWIFKNSMQAELPNCRIS